MENIWIIIGVAVFGSMGAVGGVLSIITYFSPTAVSIRQSDAKIKEIQSIKDTIGILIDAKESAEKREATIRLELNVLKIEVNTLTDKVQTLTHEKTLNQSIIEKYKVVVEFAKKCVNNKNGNCSVVIKAKELGLD
jgi:deoxyribodipyrimidine photolyase